MHIETKLMTKLTPSKYSEAIYDTFDNTNHNMLIRAGAGCGKTTNLLGIMKRTDLPKIFLAFNNSIQQEISHKTIGIQDTEVSTIHSLGCKSIMNHFKQRIEIKENKCWNFAFHLNKVSWHLDQETFLPSIVVAKQLVDLYRNTFCKNIYDLRKNADLLGIDYNEQMIECTLDLLEEYRRHNVNPREIDFADMLYIPITNSEIRIVSGAKLMLVDECQDLNRAQHAIVNKLRIQNRCRIVYVGDSHQSIYGFSGADSKSFDLCKETPNIIELPLSICYRCPTKVIEDANKVFPVLEAYEHAKEGIVQHSEDMTLIQEGDMVLCRNVKPLIQLYFTLLMLNKKVTIKGKDLGKGIQDLLKDTKGRNVGEIEDELLAILHKKAMALKSRGKDKPQNHPSYTALLEKILVLQVIMIHKRTRHEINEFLNDVFSDDDREGRGRVILSTIHKAKGLEADNIFILDTNLIPSEYAVTEDALIQEKNLLYVARTRAKKSTTYIRSQETNKEMEKFVTRLKQTY